MDSDATPSPHSHRTEPRIWYVYGTDNNVFGTPKKRRVEVIATDEAEAAAEALRHFPTMTVTSVSWTSRRPITSDGF